MTNRYTDYRTYDLERKNRQTFCYNNGLRDDTTKEHYPQRMTVDELRAKWDRQRNGLCY